mmetsp:Transcript_24512/g.82510  ORF Transcript_24512/g.82510 Transcript_24512/m.82510 type:complete len:222 (-) Transcript_24512:965-1630(-)
MQFVVRGGRSRGGGDGGGDGDGGLIDCGSVATGSVDGGGSNDGGIEGGGGVDGGDGCGGVDGGDVVDFVDERQRLEEHTPRVGDGVAQLRRDDARLGKGPLELVEVLVGEEARVRMREARGLVCNSGVQRRVFHARRGAGPGDACEARRRERSGGGLVGDGRGYSVEDLRRFKALVCKGPGNVREALRVKVVQLRRRLCEDGVKEVRVAGAGFGVAPGDVC